MTAAARPDQLAELAHVTRSAQRLTPVEQHGAVWLKRDDSFVVNGVRGGKARTCLGLATEWARRGVEGVTTASSRHSPQALIVARVAQLLGLQADLYVPWVASGGLTRELEAAEEAGATIIPVRPGHTSVISARARQAAALAGWGYVPFGMECSAAVEWTAAQCANLPQEAARVVVPVGSGMTLAGVLHGLQAARRDTPVLGVQVGADPSRRLGQYGPLWSDPRQLQLVQAGLDYSEPAPVTELDGVPLDPYYEAKCLPHLQPGDVLWVVGIRGTLS